MDMELGSKVSETVFETLGTILNYIFTRLVAQEDFLVIAYTLFVDMGLLENIGDPAADNTGLPVDKNGEAIPVTDREGSCGCETLRLPQFVYTVGS
jgi:hypothetical protein